MRAHLRHVRIRQDLIELIRAWNDAGIEPVLYKGFALAEFVYPLPGTRFHSDVDLLVSPADFSRAVVIARTLGWDCPHDYTHWAWRLKDPHERTLRRPGAQAALDLHQRLVLTVLPWTARERALTVKAHEQSSTLNWHGMRIRILSPADAFIFGLVISRCWGGDHWRLNAHDYPDAQALVARGLTQAQLVRRAAELNVGRTLGNFLRRCNPFERFVDLRPPTVLQILGWELQSATEHVPLLVGNLLTGFVRAWLALMYLPQVLPLFWEAQRALQSAPGIAEALNTLEGSSARWGSGAVDVVFYGWWARRLRRTDHPLWPIMTYTALRRRGERPVFRMGERAGRTRAWVEISGRELAEFNAELHGTKSFSVTFERS